MSRFSAQYFASSILLVSFSCVAAVVVTYLYYLGQHYSESGHSGASRSPMTSGQEARPEDRDQDARALNEALLDVVPSVPPLVHRLFFLGLGRLFKPAEVQALLQASLVRLLHPKCVNCTS